MLKKYDAIRKTIMEAAGDYIDLKAYDDSMRYMIDNYVKANDSEVLVEMTESTLLDIIEAEGLEKAREKMPEGIRNKDENVAFAIENNIAHAIIIKRNENPRYYKKMSERLNELIKTRKEQTLNYEEYLNKLVDLVKKVKRPESSGEYPASINNNRLRGLYDILDKNEETALKLYKQINDEILPDFMSNIMAQKKLKSIINNYEKDGQKIEEIFNLWKNTR